MGLSVSMTLCILVFLYVRNEYSRDSFHANKDNLFAIQEVSYLKDSVDVRRSVFDTKPSSEYRKSAHLSIPLPEAILDRIPEIQEISRFGFQNISIIKEGKEFPEQANYVDSNFFELFSFELSAGSRDAALNRPDKVVLTREMAIKYFNTENPVGEFIELSVSDSTSRMLFEVGGVVKVPSNSSLKFDFLFQIENNSYYRTQRDNWNNHNTPAFIYLSKNADLTEIEAKIDELVSAQLADRDKVTRMFRGISEGSPLRNYKLVNIKDIYFNFEAGIGETSHKLYSIILIGIAILILFIGCVNYISITIATSSSREREIGVRKVVGATQKQMFFQLYSEILMLTLISGVLSYTMTQVLLPYFNELTGIPIVLTTKDLILLIQFVLAFSFGVSLISGVYPAIAISKFRAVSVRKGRGTSSLNPRLMKILVTFQFSLCILFLTLSTTMHRQFRFISEKDLGFRNEAVVYLSGADGLSDKIKEKLLQSPAIESVSGTLGVFSGMNYSSSRKIKDINYPVRVVFTDFDFARTFEIEILEGRDLNEEFGEDKNSSSLLVNETYWNLLKQDSAFDKNAETARIVGVMKDFHFDPLTEEIIPIHVKIGKPGIFSQVFIKVNPKLLDQGIRAIEETWDSVAPEKIMDLRFLDSTLEAKYGEQKRWNNIINSATIFGTLIACIGLFGLTGINVMNRTKEIGIRKVLGANLKSLVYLLNKTTVHVILISILIATPIAIYLIDKWLDGFAYRVSITYDIFFFTFITCGLIVMATVSFHSIKTSLINPSQLLRDE